MFKRIVYLGYYFKELDWSKFNRFMKFYSDKTGKSKLRIWKEILKDSLKYNISILEYFMFDFGTKSHEEKLNWAGTGYMYEYQLMMNPVDYRYILSDKKVFLKKYSKYVHHKFTTLEKLKSSNDVEPWIFNSSKIVLKDSSGQCGLGVQVVEGKKFSKEELIKTLNTSKNDMVEEYLVQHKDLMRLSPSGLNTLRIITQLNKNDQVKVLGARLRITVDSIIDNMAGGNLAAPVDLNTGTVNGKAVYSDITKSSVDTHPITKEKIIGFQIPFWEKAIELCKAAALHDIRNRSIGWDVAITDQGPELLEGNHDWCKLLWQLPVKKGLKPVLEKYRTEFLKK